MSDFGRQGNPIYRKDEINQGSFSPGGAEATVIFVFLIPDQILKRTIALDSVLHSFQNGSITPNFPAQPQSGLWPIMASGDLIRYQTIQSSTKKHRFRNTAKGKI
jgi:hypothetical protein